MRRMMTARIRHAMRLHGFRLERLGGNVTGFVRDVPGGSIVVQGAGTGAAPARVSQKVCAYWLGHEHGEPLRELCGNLDAVLRIAGEGR